MYEVNEKPRGKKSRKDYTWGAAWSMLPMYLLITLGKAGIYTDPILTMVVFVASIEVFASLNNRRMASWSWKKKVSVILLLLLILAIITTLITT